MPDLTPEQLAAFDCLDCPENTLLIHEYYMVLDEIWNAVVPEVDGMLCVGCLEKRLGRTLTKHDFSQYPINELPGIIERSLRLTNRLLSNR